MSKFRKFWKDMDAIGQAKFSVATDIPVDVINRKYITNDQVPRRERLLKMAVAAKKQSKGHVNLDDILAHFYK